jgi:guanyl-specific ribonuclease Sa
MELVEVEITGMVITHRYGTLQTGVVLRTDKEYADHLVNDCAAAKYTAVTVSSPAATPDPQATTDAATAPEEVAAPADPQPEPAADKAKPKK